MSMGLEKDAIALYPGEVSGGGGGGGLPPNCSFLWLQVSEINEKIPFKMGVIFTALGMNL